MNNPAELIERAKLYRCIEVERQTTQTTLEMMQLINDMAAYISSMGECKHDWQWCGWHQECSKCDVRKPELNKPGV